MAILIAPNHSSHLGLGTLVMHRRQFLSVMGATAGATSAGCLGYLAVDRDTSLPPGVLNIAHRGASLHRPENTLPAFEYAIEVGADVIEMDLLTTADGEIVTIHDETVDRTTDGSGRVDEFTLEELQELDAGYRFSPDGETYPYRNQGITIPTLRTVLEELPEVWFLLEPKAGDVDVEQLLSLLDETGAIERTIIGAFDLDTLRIVREIDPSVITGLGTREFIEYLVMARRDELRYHTDAEIAFAPFELVSERLIDRSQRLDMAVHAWTVNDDAEMDRLLELGVDGILTDDPALLAERMNSLRVDGVVIHR